MKKKGKGKKKAYCLIALLALLLMPALSLAEWNQEFFDLTIKKGAGFSMNGDAQGSTGSIVIGSIYSVNHLAQGDGKLIKTKMLELGTIDIGVGSSQQDGGRVALHGGVGGCLYGILCISETYALRPELVNSEEKPWRTNYFVELFALGRLANLDAMPGIGMVFK